MLHTSYILNSILIITPYSNMVFQRFGLLYFRDSDLILQRRYPFWLIKETESLTSAFP